MARSFRWIGRAHRGLHGDHPDGGRTGPAPGGPKHSGGWRSPTILLRDAKAPWRRREIVGRSHCGSGPPAVRSPSESRGADSIGQGTRLAGAHDGNDFEARKITPSRRLLNREDAEAGKGDERKRREQIIAARCAHVEPGDDLSGPQTWKRVVSNRPPASS